MNSDHPKREVDITPIDSTNDKTCSSQIHDINVACNFYEPFFLYTNWEDVSPETEF